MNWTTWALAYVIIGLCLFHCIDRRQMSAHVPYGDFPSEYSLAWARIACALLCIVFWLPITLEVAAEKVWAGEAKENR